MTSRSVEVRGETVELLPERAVYWPRRRILFVADLHLGKAAAFRSAGVPIPHGTTAADLGRLTELVSKCGPERLIILGDFLHARDGRVEKTFAEVGDWRAAHSALGITLVRGNHDVHAGDPPDGWSIQVVDEPYPLEPFVCAHHDVPSDDYFVLQGHIHPKVHIGRRKERGKRFPCFVLDASRLVLPAFGTFTGGVDIPSTAKRARFAIADGEVLPVD
ncbi:MAG: ligase-associated DNA damage response endonuclease PdeM [Bdellovibrionota bacterium]